MYYFALDAATGTTKGQGDNDFGQMVGRYSGRYR
ncbi:MAG: hypothetical protein ABR571_12895 [Jatrophihabitans sp.]